MIDKQALRDLITDNTMWGMYEDKPFFIFDSWETIKQANKLQGIIGDDSRICSHCKQSIDSPGCGSDNLGGHYTPYLTPNNKLEFEQLLAYIDSDYPFPVTDEDINRMITSLEYQALIDKGQLTFLEWEWNLPYPPETAKIILDWYKQHEDDDPLYWINDSIKDELSDKVDWGFSDEYSTCSNCSNVIRTSPDCYAWTLQGILIDDEGYYCPECAKNSGLDEERITEIQERIDNNEEPKSFPDIFDISEDWYKITHPQYSWHYWENGMHPGQNDSPLKQGKLVRNVTISQNGEILPVFQIIYRIFPEQFTISWDAYIRVNPEVDIPVNSLKYKTGYSMEDWLQYFFTLFDSPDGKTRYDLASLYSKALQMEKGNFSSISVDPESGEIHITNYDSPEDMMSK